MQVLETWIKTVIKAGYNKDLPPGKKFNAWHEKKLYRVIGHTETGHIFEIVHSNVYLRINKPENTADQYKFWRFRSIDYPWFPKTDFYLSDLVPQQVLTEAQITAEIIAELNSPN